MRIRVGQVYTRKGTQEKICIGAINTELRKIWVNGLIDEVCPIITYEYLAENFELDAGWSI